MRLSIDDNNVVYPFQGTHLVILTDAEPKAHSLPPSNSIHRFIMTDLVNDTLHLFSHNHKECANYLLRLPEYLYSTRIDDFKYNITEQITESILLQIISLPKPDLPVVYYHSVLFDIFTSDPKHAPSAIGKCVRSFYDKFDSHNVDIECVRRFGGWFSHHLSNFGFIWKWAEWEYVCSEVDSMKFVFLKECLGSCVRFGYYDRVKTMLPEAYLNTTVFPTHAPRVNYKYDVLSCQGKIITNL